jgi:hypothetical protein
VRKLSGSHGFAASDEQVAVPWLSNWPWCVVTADTNLLLTVNQRQFSGLINGIAYMTRHTRGESHVAFAVSFGLTRPAFRVRSI